MKKYILLRKPGKRVGNRNLSCFIWLVSIFTFLNFSLIIAEADEVLFLMYTIYKNDTLFVNDLTVTNAPVLLPKDKGDYKIEIVDTKDVTIFSSKFDVKFLILSDPPRETNESLMLFKIPWNEAMKKIRFYHLDRLIHTIEICNKNNQCESKKGENTINCPEDCKPKPTCGNNKCELGENYENCPQDCPKPEKPGMSIWIYIIVGIVIASVIGFFLYKIKWEKVR